MRFMHLQPVMNGKLRIAVPKEKVNGWKHTSVYGLHFFSRGHIRYILTPNDEKGALLEKFDCKRYKYLDVYDFDTEFKKFYDIKVVDVQRAVEKDNLSGNITYQGIFETLSKLEAELFYRDVVQGKDGAAHAVLHEAVKKFSEATGCHL